MDPLGAPAPDGAATFMLAFSRRFQALIGTTVFGAAVDCFDATRWRRSTSKARSDALILLAGTPSDAIDGLFTYSEERENQEGREKAALDCVEIIEVCRWLAERDVIGVAAFDRKYGGARFTLAAPGSTGVVSLILAVRSGGGNGGDSDYFDAGGPLTGTMNLTDGTVVNLAAYLEALPIGSRVMWRTFDRYVHREDDFKNENTVKLGDDLYGAHPLGVWSLTQMGAKFAEAHFESSRDRVTQARDEIADAEKELIVLREALPPAGPEGKVSGSLPVVVDGPTAAVIRDSFLKDEGGPGATVTVSELAQAVTKRKKQISDSTAVLEYYADIANVEAYIAKFVRVVEAETFVNPCASPTHV